MVNRTKGVVISAILVGLAFGICPRASAQYLQVDVTRFLRAGSGRNARFAVPVEAGQPAVLSGVLRDLRSRDSRPGTVSVDLLLDYTLPQGQVGFDELIDRIEVTTEDAAGTFATVVLDTRLIPLNPNRAPLSYRVTLYHPEGRYAVRVRLFGNYE